MLRGVINSIIKKKSECFLSHAEGTCGVWVGLGNG